ncbi:gamma-aminobutyrate:proton symporter (AAT family) [Aneurinibacillus soli]|uniref:GABA permease n=1 Tax=Aneurinibacillus soli TaxID=1500254 RepID=A0A0U5AX14_9BACL|nr:amino acid permease [Aneurinibacillus soli]PYE64312.1 gamma-aminobutyrate:proton symporter (AAT family) [Aneurinibacillus soli]BAU28261.1 GABA permease [Aneurinibacillus soli]
MAQNNGLHGGLKARHLKMISLGGVIGAGLFVGSGAVIGSTGPGAIVSYSLAGLIVILVMRMLGEMATVKQESGSFAAYAREMLGPWAGFSIGWLYWFFWVIVIAIEAIAGAAIVHQWIPSIPVWALSLILTTLLTLTNLYSVKSFGEFEYWFSLIKVVTIVVFLAVGAVIIAGFFPGIEAPGMKNLTQNGGFMPFGVQSILLGIVIVIFSFFGTEIAAIAAGESDNPEKGVMTAINSVVWRILLFFIGSVAILVTLLPWNSANLLKSPFVTVFDMIGIPAAAQIMNVVVLTSVLSCLNSALYTNSRMLYALAQKGDAPKSLLKLSARGIPSRAVWASTAFAFLVSFFNFVSPDKLFLFLVNASGAIALLVYIVIAFSHISFRKQMERENPSGLKIRMWFFPYLSYATIVVLFGILIAMAFVESMRSQFYLTMLITVCTLAYYFFFHRKKVQAADKAASLKV